jgi:hypothetical protein
MHADLQEFGLQSLPPAEVISPRLQREDVKISACTQKSFNSLTCCYNAVKQSAASSVAGPDVAKARIFFAWLKT